MARNEEDELLACPFCGSEDVTICEAYTTYDAKFAHCLQCQAEGPIALGSDEASCKSAVEKWNKRVDS